jgi:hypothetical protein
MSRIKLVQGDTLPYINLNLTNSDGSVLDVSSALVSVQVLFRAAGSTTTLNTITCTKPNGGSDGVVQFDFEGGILNVDPGAYEGEVVINFSGGRVQTVYDLLKFYVRQR